MKTEAVMIKLPSVFLNPMESSCCGQSQTDPNQTCMCMWFLSLSLPFWRQCAFVFFFLFFHFFCLADIL